MIIGHGLIASAFIGDFAARSDIVIFASGVSNSREQSSEAFIRERDLLVGAVRTGKKIVYFSTCSLYDPKLQGSPYVMHKREMESIVEQSSNYAIFRLPQVVGKAANSNTLTNYIHTKIVTGERFDVWRYAKRNLIDVADVAAIAKFVLCNVPCEKVLVNLAAPTSVSVVDLVHAFELVLGMTANYSLINSGGAYEIDTKFVDHVAKQIGISFDETYIERVIRKYYGK